MKFIKDIPKEPGLYWVTTGQNPEVASLDPDGGVDFIGIRSVFNAKELVARGMLWGDRITSPVVLQTEHVSSRLDEQAHAQGVMDVTQEE